MKEEFEKKEGFRVIPSPEDELKRYYIKQLIILLDAWRTWRLVRNKPSFKRLKERIYIYCHLLNFLKKEVLNNTEITAENVDQIMEKLLESLWEHGLTSVGFEKLSWEKKLEKTMGDLYGARVESVRKKSKV